MYDVNKRFDGWGGEIAADFGIQRPFRMVLVRVVCPQGSKW
jgi:hypothetical protein